MSYKKYLAAIAGRTPVCELWEMRKRMPRILFYHGVMSEPYYDQRVQANQIQLKEFERQIDYLQHRYHFISMDEFYERFQQRDQFTGKELVLTFDDGYKNNLSAAAPLLVDRQIPFTVFVATRLVDSEGFVPTYYVRSAILSPAMKSADIPSMKRQFLLNSDAERMTAMNEVVRFIKTHADAEVHQVITEIEEQFGTTNRSEADSHFGSERIMSWEDASELQRLGAVIGSHSEDHSVLHDQQTSADLQMQLQDSRNKIVQHLGSCRYFAFPNGDAKAVCERSLMMASEIYEMSFAVTGKSVSYSDPKAFISRIGVAFDLYMLRTQLSLLA